MPWCPLCKAEYREGFAWCSDCEAELADELDKEAEGKKDHPDNESSVDEWQLLGIINDEQEANIIESLLTSENIPVQRRYKGVSHMSKIAGGMTKLGIHFYVLGNNLQETKELLKAIRNEEPNFLEENPEEEEIGSREHQEKYEDQADYDDRPLARKPNYYSRLLIYAVILVLGGLVISMWSILKHILQ